MLYHVLTKKATLYKKLSWSSGLVDTRLWITWFAVRVPPRQHPLARHFPLPIQKK